MSITGLDAAKAYAAALGSGTTAAPGVKESTGGPSFGDALKDVMATVADAAERSEKASIAGASGQMDIVSVINEVSNAEMVLDTVVAVRDRVIAAYQEIMRMPI
jgi:flagellar hook-basal body complex protein FliE